MVNFRFLLFKRNVAEPEVCAAELDVGSLARLANVRAGAAADTNGQGFLNTLPLS